MIIEKKSLIRIFLWEKSTFHFEQSSTSPHLLDDKEGSIESPDKCG